MFTKQLIEAELNNLNEEQLNQVYGVIQQLNGTPKNPKKTSLMSRLKQISIDAPKDFSLKIATDLGRDISER